MSGTAPVKEEEPVTGHLNLRQTRDLRVPSSDQTLALQGKPKALFICGNSKNMLGAFTAAGI